MQPLVRVGPWLVAVTLVVLVVVAWARAEPALTSDDAAEVAVGALASQDVDVTVASPPTLATFESESGATVAVWDIALAAGEDKITVKIPVDVGELVFIDDNIGPAAAPGRLLTDAQIDELDHYEDNPAVDRRTRHNVAISIGALIAFVVAIGITRGAATGLGPDANAGEPKAPTT